MKRPTLSERALIHADNMQSEGWYTTANVLAECAEALKEKNGIEAYAFLSSIRTRVGQIEKALKNPTANSSYQIELACSKLLDAAASLARAVLTTDAHNARAWHQCVEDIMTIAGLNCALGPLEASVEFQRWASTVSSQDGGAAT